MTLATGPTVAGVAGVAGATGEAGPVGSPPPAGQAVAPDQSVPSADRPYHHLAGLPRTVWLPSLVASAGEREARLVDTRHWLQALQEGRLPPAGLDLGDPQALPVLRAVVGELGLPALCRGVPSLAEQVMRTLLWHLDHIVDHQPRLARAEAVTRVAEAFRAEWEEQTQGLDEELAWLQGLGDLAHLRWDELRGQLATRPWQAARQAAERLARLPALAALIEQLGRAERQPEAPQRPPPPQEGDRHERLPVRAVETRLPEAPGEIVGIRYSARPERMLAAEAVMLRHPVLRTLWRARHAEARLLSWQTEAVLVDRRVDPQARPRVASAPDTPPALARGPILLCLDTSGSMRGGPEQVAKAVVIAALRAAHGAGRGCRLIAFGGPGELIEHDLGLDAAGLERLLALMGQAFDGGTDIQTPIERAIECVHEARWRSADLLIVSDGEFGCVPSTLARLDEARERLGLRVQGVLVGDRETLGLLEVCDAIHWVRDWRRYAGPGEGGDGRGFSPVHSKSLTALYFPNALSSRAARHKG